MASASRGSAPSVSGRILSAAAGLVGVLWAAATVGFVLTRLAPGDPVSVMLGPQAIVSEPVKDSIRAELGLDRPVWTQYLDYLGQLARGDLGESYQLRLPVIEVIGRQAPATLQLTALAIVIALILAVGTAILARGRGRTIAALVELVVLSSPVFWIGLMLLTVFAFGLGWFPVSGFGFASLILPAATLALPSAALISQVLRDGLETAGQQPFIMTVRARGVGATRELSHHTLRHASVGALTLAGFLLGSLLGGAVLVETVFGRAGLGQVALAAITDRDLPVIAGLILLSAMVFAALGVIIEFVVPLIDPRLRRGRL